MTRHFFAKIKKDGVNRPFSRSPWGQPRSGGGERGEASLRISNLAFIEGLLQIQSFIDGLDRLIGIYHSFCIIISMEPSSSEV